MLFGSLDDYREVNQQTIVTINGTPYRAIGLPQRTIALNRQRSSCTVTLEQEPPTFAAGSVVPAWVDITVNGTSRRFYTGTLGSKDVDSTTRTITLGDVLWKLNRMPEQVCSGTGPLILDNDTPENALVKVLNAAGVTADEMVLPFTIPDGIDAVCPVASRCIEANENLQQVFETLCEFLGAAAYCLPMSGKLVVLPYDTRPTESPALAFDNDGGYAVIDLKRHSDDPKNIVTVFTARGPAPVVDGIAGIEPEAIWRVVEDSENPLEIAGRPDEMTNEFIQTQGQAWAVAEREGRLRCRVEQRYVMPCAMDTDVLPGMSVQVKHSLANVSARTPMYVVGVSVQGTTMDVELSSGESRVTGYQDKQFIADFAMQVVAETVLISGTPTTIYDVSLDASGSIGDGITSYTWSVSGTTPRVAPADGVTSFAVLNAVAGVTITLTVSDGEDNSASMTLALDAPTVKTLYRMLHAAVDGQWCVQPQDTWLRWTPPGTTVTAVARYNEVGPLWCGCANGAVYKRSQDNLDQSPELVTTLDAAITDIYVGEPFVTESIINTVAAAHSTKVSWTHDAGESWHDYDFGVAANAVQVDPYNRHHMLVCVGNKLVETYNGAVWREVIVNPDSNAVARDVGNAPWDTCVVFSGTTGANQIVFASGFAWTGDALSGAPQTVTPGVTEETFRVFTDNGSVFLLTKETTAYTVTAIGQTDATEGNTKRAVRDGKYSAVYFADAAYLGKQLNDDEGHIYELHSGAATRIGYAGLDAREDPLRYRFLIPTWGAAAGDGGIWEYDRGTWTLRKAGLPTDVTLYGTWIAANPNNSNEWVALFHVNDSAEVIYSGTKIVSVGGTYSPLWIWDGSIWSEVILSTSISGTNQIIRCEYNDDGKWGFLVRYPDGSNIFAIAWGSGLVHQAWHGFGGQYGSYCIGGVDGDWIVQIQGYGGDWDNDDIRYVDSGGTLYRPSGSNVGQAIGYMAKYPGESRKILLIKSDRNQLWGTQDYRAAQPTNLGYTAPQSRNLAIISEEQVFHSSSSGLVRIDDPFGSPSGTTVAFDGVDIGLIRIDRQNRRIIAGIGSAAYIYNSRNGVSSAIDLSGLSNLAAKIEVVTD